ncbi:MAG: aspartyl/glutamyl-tRNA amidotransferase subunit A [Acidobacteriaceae bacterium]|nr:aspartyl/glutamyl-tRNA amidotransferase subunit A [Acidobacteriaceae bacterium]MBV9781231.1 aspartyl/glutamyl-tRNA amidotransferase subunit A [Acidobacteriaceae bacterium]
MTVREIGWLLRARKLSCVELVQKTVANVKSREELRALITFTEEDALKEARERDEELAAGIDRGPFHGIPTAHKDLFYTRGIRTTGGSLVFRDFIPKYDATVVERLKAAGAISIGKANLHELAYGTTSKNPHYGFVLNPRDTSRIAGGSSGGSAVLIAAGFLPVALGTDTGGSIRIPASFCGVTGLKPTYGRVSRYGVLPLAFGLDHVGPLASCVEDCALAMNEIAGHDPFDPSSAKVPVPDFNLPALGNLKGVRVGIPKNFYFERVDEEIARAVQSSISEMKRQGAALSELRIPDMHEVNTAARIIQLSEATALYAHHSDPALFGEDVWNLIQQGKLIAGHEYVNAQRIRTLFRRDFDALWKEIDVLVTPTTPITAPLLTENSVRIGQEPEDTRIASTRLVRGLNFLGEPALSMPCGRTPSGLPVGLQLISAPFSEPKLLQAARTLEAALA